MNYIKLKEKMGWFVYRNILSFNWLWLYLEHLGYSRGEMARFTGKCPCAMCVKKYGGISWDKMQNYLKTIKK